MSARVLLKYMANARQRVVFLTRYMLTGKIDLLLCLALCAKHVRLGGLVFKDMATGTAEGDIVQS